MKQRTFTAILIPVIVVLAFGAFWLLRNPSDNSEKVIDEAKVMIDGSNNVIFRIGHEEIEVQFKEEDSEPVEVFSCEVGTDCLNETFPGGHLRFIDSPYNLDGAVKIEIKFKIDKKYDNPVLRLIRAGSETTEVSLNGGEKLLVTAEMLGSAEGGILGAYNLELASLDEGSHSIELTVADDGNGNGVYGFTAIILYESAP